MAAHSQLVLPSFPRSSFIYPPELVEPVDYDCGEATS